METPLTPEQGLLLGDALRKVLVHVGVIRHDAAPTGPELLAVVEDFVGNRGGERPVVVDPFVRTHEALNNLMGLFGQEIRTNPEMFHKDVEVLQWNYEHMHLPITASFNKENWSKAIAARKAHLESRGLKYLGPAV